MARLIGLFKELEGDEQLLYEPKNSVLTILAKELEVKKLMGVERKEFNLIYATAYPYLTNKRLMLLTLHQVESKLLLEHKAPKIPTRSGVWLEVPIKAISVADLKPLDLKKDHDLAHFLAWAGLEEGVLDRAPAIEVVYDDKQSKGRIRDYIDMILEIGVLVKDQRKVERAFDKLILVGEEVASELLPPLKDLVSKTLSLGEDVGEEPLV